MMRGALILAALLGTAESALRSVPAKAPTKAEAFARNLRSMTDAPARTPHLVAKTVDGHLHLTIKQQKAMHFGCVETCKPSPVESKCVTGCEADMYRCIDETGPNEGPPDTAKCQGDVLKSYKEASGKQSSKKEKKPKEASKTEEKPDEASKTEEKPKEVSKAEEKPKEASKAEEKPKEASKAEEKPKEASKAEEKPKEASKAEEKPKEASKAEEKPKEASKAEEKPKSLIQIVRGHDEDDADDISEDNEESDEGEESHSDEEEADETSEDEEVSNEESEHEDHHGESEDDSEEEYDDEDPESFLQMKSSWKPEPCSELAPGVPCVKLYEHPQGSTFVSPCPVDSHANAGACSAYFGAKPDAEKCPQISCPKALGVTMKLTCGGGCCPTCWAPDHVIAMDRHTTVDDAAVVGPAPQAPTSCTGVKCFQLSCASGFSEGFVNGDCCYSCVPGR